MKQNLKKKVSTIRDKMLSLIDDLNDRIYELEERDDPDGVWQEEIDEISEMIEMLEQQECDLSYYDE